MRVAKFLGTEFPRALYLEEDRKQDEIARIFDPILERTFHGTWQVGWHPNSTSYTLYDEKSTKGFSRLTHALAEEAHKKRWVQINSDDLQTVFPRYSEARLNDLLVEDGTRLSGMDELILSFKPTKATGKTVNQFRYTNDRIAVHLKEVLRSRAGKIRFAYEKGSPDFRRILDFLYRIDFLQAWFRNQMGLSSE